MAASIKIIYTFEDGKGKQSTTEVKVPSITSFSDIIIFAQQMAVLLDNLTTGRLVSAGIAFTVDLSGLGLGAAASGDSDVEEKGYFQFVTAGGFNTSLNIPTFAENLVSAGGSSIDTADTDVAAFVSAMRNGIDLTTVTPTPGSGTIEPSDSRDDDITTLSSAIEVFQSSRRSR